MTYAQTPVNYLTIREVADTYYSTLPDPATAEWPVAYLKMLINICGGHRPPDRYNDILANALASLPADDYEWFTSTYSVPAPVIDKLSNLPAWPDPEQGAAESFPEGSTLDLAVYADKMDRRLVAHAENQAARAIKVGHRQTSAYIQKYQEAQRWGTLDQATKDAAVHADFPYIFTYAGNHGLSTDAAAATIVAMGDPWNQTNAAIEGEREKFQLAAASATDADGVKTAYETHAAAITGIMDALEAAV